MKGKLLYGIALLTLGATSCSTEVEFDQEAYDASIKKAFVVEAVDPGHNWATVGKADAAITVNGDYGKEYTVAIYLENPMAVPTVTQLYVGRALSGSTQHVAVSYPLSQDFVYVAIYDEAGRRVVLNAPIRNGRIDVGYGAPADSRGARRATEAEEAAYAKTFNDYLNPEAPNTWTTVKSVNAEDLKTYTAFTDDDLVKYLSAQNYTLSNLSYIESPACYLNHGDGKHYRIASGTEIKRLFHWNATQNVINDCVLYVEGKLHLDGNSLNGPTIVVASGGEVVIDGDTHCTNAGRFVVMAGGKITGAKGKLWDNSNGSICYNAGLIDFEGTLNLNGTNFYNCGTVDVDILTGTAGDTKFTNFGRITARTNSNASTTYNQTWVNGCYVHFTENAGLGSSVMLTGSRFDIDGDCTPMAGTCEMHTQSELKVGGMLMLNGNTFSGPTGAGDYAIVKTGKMYAGWEDAISVSGRVYFDFDPNEIYGMWSSREKNYKRDMNANDYKYSAAYGIVNRKITYWVNEQNALSEITIPEGCGGTGFNADGNDGDKLPDTQSFSMRYCFEDNFPDAGDYDFNDVVLTVSPTLVDKTLTLKVSLDAVGAQKTIGAAIRIVGLHSTDLDSYTATKAFTPLPANYDANYQNINTGETFLTENQAPNNTGSMVVVLFKDAHWAINPVQGDNVLVQNAFYNTVKRDDNYENKRYVEPQEAEYTFVFKDAEKAQSMLSENLYDVFIVEPYGASYYEVHTVQNGFKTAEVITEPKPVNSQGKSYAEAYGSNMPWAIMVPGTFRYPLEWQVIGTKAGGALSGAYKSAGHAFGEWAENSSNATDWFNYPTDDLVFE